MSTEGVMVVEGDVAGVVVVGGNIAGVVVGTGGTGRVER